MQNVIIVGGLDVAELVFYLFFGFFLCLVWYLNRESRREGYPLEDDLTGKVGNDVGRLDFSSPKRFQLPLRPRHLHSGRRAARPDADQRAAAPRLGRAARCGGRPAQLGRRARPAMPSAPIAPMSTCTTARASCRSRIEPHITVEKSDVDPRGLPVVGAR